MRVLFSLLLLTACLTAAHARAAEYRPEPVSRNQTLLRSALLPGLGQIEQGRMGRGAFWAGGALVLATATFHAHMEYHSAAEDFENAQDRYRIALADEDGDAAYDQYLRMERHGALADDRYDNRRLLEIGLLLWWAGNLADTWLFDGGPDGGDQQAALPGRLQPVLLRGEAAGLAWTMDF